MRCSSSARADGPTERHLYAVSLDAAEPERDPKRLTAEPGWHAVVASATARAGPIPGRTSSTRHPSPSATATAATPCPSTRPQARRLRFGRRPPELRSVTAADGTTPPGRRPLPAGRTGRHTAAVRGVGLWRAACAVRQERMGDDAFRRCANTWPSAASRCWWWTTAAPTSAAWPSRRRWPAIWAASRSPTRRRGGAARRSRRDRRGARGDDRRQLRRLHDPDVGHRRARRLPRRRGDRAGHRPARLRHRLHRALPRPAQDEPEAYARSSVLPHAESLNGSVLVIHGAIDENVHLRHSIRLVAAVQATGRDLELVVLPEDRHRVRSPTGLRTRDRRTVQHLLPGPGRRPAGRIRNRTVARRCRRHTPHGGPPMQRRLPSPPSAPPCSP